MNPMASRFAPTRAASRSRGWLYDKPDANLELKFLACSDPPAVLDLAIRSASLEDLARAAVTYLKFLRH
jgi:hypothetical protein